MDPLVSVCCVTFNHSLYIEETIRSFLHQQTSFPFEIIIHDDASTDGTTAIVSRLAAEHPQTIRTIFQQENIYSTGKKPFPITFNSAKGKYVATCDGDDRWTDPTKLQQQFDLLEANPDHIGCFHQTVVVKDGVPTGKIMGANAKAFLQANDTFSTLSPFHISSLFFRNTLLEFPDWFGSVHSSDMALICLLADKGSLLAIPQQMSIYRQDAHGVTHEVNKHHAFHARRIELMQLLNLHFEGRYNDRISAVISDHQKELDKVKGSFFQRIKWHLIVFFQNRF